MSIPPPPPPMGLRPNPGACTNGRVHCNNPFLFDGHVIGYCDRLVWPERLLTKWRRRPGHPGKAHRLGWWTA